MSSTAADSSHVDIFLFSHPHHRAYQLLHSAADIEHSLTFHSPTAVPIPLSASATFHPTLLIADVYPVPSHPQLTFSSLVYFYDAFHSSTSALDTSRRHITSLLHDRPNLPILIVLYVEPTTDIESQHTVDYDTIFSALDCDKLSNPVNVISFADGSASATESARKVFQWLHDMLHPPISSTPQRWSSSTSIAPLLTPHLPAELIDLTLSYLSCSTRGAFLSEAEHAAQQTQLQRLREASERKQQRKELLRFLSAYSHHHTRHQSEDDSTFVHAIMTAPAPFLYPNSSYAHLDLLRLAWHAMRLHGIRRGAAVGWQQMQALLDQETCKRLLGHWAIDSSLERVVPDDRLPLAGVDGVEQWRHTHKATQDRIARTRRIFHTTRWACILQHLANAIQHSHTTHPTHHHYTPLPPPPHSHNTPQAHEEMVVDVVPECWSSFGSFLGNHTELLTLSFVSDYYSDKRLEAYDSWVGVVSADKCGLVYWLPVLRDLLDARSGGVSGSSSGVEQVEAGVADLNRPTGVCA